jgi:hypothetical protein
VEARAVLTNTKVNRKKYYYGDMNEDLAHVEPETATNMCILCPRPNTDTVASSIEDIVPQLPYFFKIQLYSASQSFYT